MADPRTGALRQMITAVEDDLAQMGEVSADLAGRLAALDDGAQPEQLAYVALELHRWFTVAESVFQRIERTLVGSVPQGGDWHQELLRIVALEIEHIRPAVIRGEVARSLGPYLRFRHFLRHAYAVTLDARKLRALVSPLAELQAALEADLQGFLKALRDALDRAQDHE